MNEPVQNADQGAQQVPVTEPVAQPTVPTIQPTENPVPQQEQPQHASEPVKETPQPAPQEPVQTPVEFNADAYNKYTVEGNQDASLILDIFKQNKVDHAVFETVFQKAMQTEKVSDIDVEALKSALGDTNAAIVLKLTESISVNNQSEITAMRTQAHEMFGGEHKFNACVEWSKSVQDPTMQAKISAYKSMIDQGGEQAKLGLQAIKDLYMTSPITSVAPRSLTGVATSALPSDAITTKADYFRLYQAAYNNNDHAQMADINRRWQAGKRY